ncbi:MAG: hypothetical protein JSS44_05685 [Proteobacteria bacterium]|nr:hypothetical protein [Pseudomonadota bacterium]
MIHRPHRSLLRGTHVALAGIVLALAACGGIKPSQDRAQELTLYDFTSAMRWGDFNAAYDFVDPETKKDHPLTDLERERFKQVEVAGYEVVANVQGTDTIDRKIKLDLVNRNTQIPRTVTYHEHWRWDPTLKHWWLSSGLPDISPQN